MDAAMREQQSPGLALIEALVNDRPDDAALATLWRAARAWLATGAAMPLERYAHLPTAPGALRNATRNLWIRRAAEQLAPDVQTFVQARLLEKELSTFFSRGPWCAWREMNHPPESASKLNTALFYVAKFNGGDSLSSRHIARVIASN